MTRQQTSDSSGSARWANGNDFDSEGILYFSPFEHDPSHFRTESSKKHYLSRSALHRAFILGRLGDPKKLMQGIREGYEPALAYMLDGLGSLFSSLFNQSSNGKSGYGHLLGWAGDGHVLTVAPTRSGKGVGLVVPNLLHYPGSVIVCDPKGENYAITARFRRTVLKQQIICLDPFHVVSDVTDSINPLEGIIDYKKPVSDYHNQNPELLDEASMIAEAVIMRGTEEKDPHWNDKCRAFLKGIILAVMCGMGPQRRRHLGEVRALITAGSDKLIELLVDMEMNRTAAGGQLSRASCEIQSMGAEELKNVISVALKHTEFLDSRLMLDALGEHANNDEGTYNLRNLKTHGGVSIYMIMPPHYLGRYVRAIRLWITLAIAAITRSKEKPADGCPILFILDEMAQFGTMEMMRQAVSLLAGYGMSIWMIWQDLSQLKTLYEHDWPSFLANAKIQQFFGVNDHETAKYISEMLGSATIQTRTTTSGTGKSGEGVFGIGGTTNRSTGISTSEIARNLLNPDEVRRLSRNALLMFVQGIPPILAERITYYQDEMFIRRADPNPYI